MVLLTQFLLRLCFGLAAGMALVSPRQVTSGYFRNHLYVTLGLASFAALVSRVACRSAFALAVAAAVISYFGAALWLYEKPRLGKIALVAVALTSLAGALQAAAAVPLRRAPASATAASDVISPTTLRQVQTVTAGLVLGVTMAAMLLGHWYLNAPGMQLAPLRRLLQAMAAAVVIHAIVCGLGLGLEIASQSQSSHWWLFVALRWTFGLAGVLVLAAMAWQTLAIPNTQSATGILYVAVIGTFVGETMSLLLSAESVYPV